MSGLGALKPGEGRIPSSMIDTYLQYKRDTGAVIAWLVSHGTSKYKRLSALSLQDLHGLAEIVQTKAVEMPGTVDFQFRQAIAARTHLSKWYRKVQDHYEENYDHDTCNHEHFTTCLSKIYKDLCNCCAQSKDKCARKKQPKRAQDKTQIPLNRFATLGFNTNTQASEYEYSNDQLEETAKESGAKRPISAPPRLLDDTLSEAFELHKEVQDMHDLLTITQLAWEQSAKAVTSVVVATFVTHLAFAEFEDIQIRLKTSCGVRDPGILRSKYMQMEEEMDLPTVDEKKATWCPKSMIESLREYWLEIAQLKLGGPQSLSMKGCSHILLREGSGPDSKDRECVKTMIKDIGQHISSGTLQNRIVRVGSPVIGEVGLFLTSPERDPNSLRCSFGLQLLLQSYKSYLFTSSSRALPSSCRLQSLRFAQQATTSITAVLDASSFGCRCPNTLAGNLDQLELELQSFLRNKIFDLYFQSPWVSGSHILEMLDSLFCAGLRLFNHHNYVSSVLHLYNVLRQFASLKPIPIFENIIESNLGSIVFPGGRPCHSFKACYARSLGSRLCFESNNKVHFIDRAAIR